MRAAGIRFCATLLSILRRGCALWRLWGLRGRQVELVGLLLGWSRPAQGEVWVDGRPIGQCLESLRRHTAWVDPAVQIWNRSFLENIRYGSPLGHADEKAASMLQVLDAADLRRVLERLPEGLRAALGEGGALVSGGEGQRCGWRGLFCGRGRDWLFWMNLFGG